MRILCSRLDKKPCHPTKFFVMSNVPHYVKDDLIRCPGACPVPSMATVTQAPMGKYVWTSARTAVWKCFSFQRQHKRRLCCFRCDISNISGKHLRCFIFILCHKQTELPDVAYAVLILRPINNILINSSLFCHSFSRFHRQLFM